MALTESEKALILGILAKTSGLGDPSYKRSLAEIALDALDKIASRDEPLRVVHVDAGGRTLEAPGTPASIVKLAVYTLELRPQPNGELWYHTYKLSLPEGTGLFHILYAKGDYRVRQALTYIVEIASLLYWLRRLSTSGGVVIGVKDGPLVQQLAQYLSPRFDLPEKTARSALYYAGLDPGTVEILIEESKRENGAVSSGALMASILDRLLETAAERNAYPAGVVENTSRSSTLLFKLTAEAIVNLVLGAAESPNFEIDSVYAASLRASQFFGESLGADAGRLSRCLCESEDEIKFLAFEMPKIMNTLLERLNQILAKEGLSPGLTGIRDKALEVGFLEAVRAVVRALARGQLLPFSSRDPDIVMAAYYLGFLDSHATKEFERHELHASAQDAMKARRFVGESAFQDEGVEERVFRVIDELKARYLVVDPPPTCSYIQERLRQSGIAELQPCLLAASDTYTYAPPIRLEYYRDPGSPLSLVELAFLEAFLTRYKYPQGVMVADIASRVRYEEALTARPLAERLIPLRYYIRSWEKRVEHM